MTTPLPPSTEIDELAESIMDCIMNSHVISDEGQAYVESFLPTTPSNAQSICIELFEKVDKDRVQKVAILFKTHEEAKKWYQQYRQYTAANFNKGNKRAIIIDNVIFKQGDQGKQLYSYVELICEFIDQQPICVLQHSVSDNDLKLAENYQFYYKINWRFKGYMPTSTPAMKSEQNRLQAQQQQYIEQLVGEPKNEDSLVKQELQNRRPQLKTFESQNNVSKKKVKQEKEHAQTMLQIQRQIPQQQQIPQQSRNQNNDDNYDDDDDEDFGQFNSEEDLDMDLDDDDDL